MMHKFVYIFISFLLVLAWLWRYQMTLLPLKSLVEGQLVRVRGEVTSQPYRKGSKQIISVGAFNASLEAWERIEYGDNVELSGTLDTGVTSFSSPKIWLSDPTIRLVEQGESSRSFGFVALARGLLKVRAKLMQLFGRILPEPQSSLLSGVVLGVKRQLPYQFSLALRNTGTLHVVVASGYNVTVVAGVITVLVVRFLSRRWAIPFILIGVGAYTVMAGADPPIMRAAIMGSLAYIAQLLGRQYTGLWALVVASVVMLLVSPLMLFDVGFQLSVAATAGILLLVPILIRKLWFLKRYVGRGLVEEFSVTLGAQLAVFPLLVFHFKQASWLSPLVNLAVGFVVPVIMGMGGLIALASVVSSSLAQLLGYFIWVPLTYFVKLVLLFDKLPFGVLQISKASGWMVVIWYLGLGWYVWRYSRRRAVKRGL